MAYPGFPFPLLARRERIFARLSLPPLLVPVDVKKKEKIRDARCQSGRRLKEDPSSGEGPTETDITRAKL
jgi:hypothetical protein